MNHVYCDHRVLIDELRCVRIVGQDPAHLCRGQDHDLRLLSSKKRLSISLASKVQFFVRTDDDIGVSRRHKAA